LFWRDKALTVLDRDGVLDLYLEAIEKYDIPILSIEDGFSEEDFEGWQKLLDSLGDRIFVIGDDLVTTNDATIELASSKGLINTALIKANQIGSLYETLLAMLVALGKGMELVVSHRSKSPNDDMEAQIAMAVNSLGLKAGGGANTERLIKYHAVTELMQRGVSEESQAGLASDQRAFVQGMYAYEEPTNAGVPTVGATVEVSLPDAGVSLKFRGATPLGTSAGTGEAIHLVDAVFERAEYREVIDSHPSFFREVEPGVFAFARDVSDEQIKAEANNTLAALFARSQRYEGKGCLNAADNVRQFIAPAFAGRPAAALTLKDIDKTLLLLELNISQRRGKTSDSAEADEQVAVMQRKQNLGMNAMLSVSLALARAVAHLQGKDLYEILREEMYSIIERLARDNGVTVEGTKFSDYVATLRTVNDKLEADGKQLHTVLRATTGIYQQEEQALQTTGGEIDEESAGPVTSTDPVMPPPVTTEDEPEVQAQVVSATASLTTDIALSDNEQKQLEEISHAMHSACRDRTDLAAMHQALYHYGMLRQSLAHRAERFNIVNNRVFMSADALFVPYMISDVLIIQAIKNGKAETVLTRRMPKGTIITDKVLLSLVELDGDPIDFERELSELTPENAGVIRLRRIRDMVAQLERINRSVNRNEALFILRSLVARVSLFSFKQYLSAKNLQSEVYNVIQQLTQFVNTVGSERRPFLLRMLVRNIISVISKPKLIDHLWNDTIELAEIHVRGSDIVNELRRSSHHAIGRHTLALAQAYLTYLDSGDTSELAGFGYPVVGSADEEARTREHPRQLVSRIIHNIEDLLGSTETVSRIREWQAQYEATLGRCEFGRSLREEASAAAAAIHQPNRWSFYHHVRIIKDRVAKFAPDLVGAADIVRRLDALLLLKPGDGSFDADAADKELRLCVEDFEGAAFKTYQKDLFDDLEGFLTLYQHHELFDTFRATSHLRKQLRGALSQRAFPEQRLLLYQLDCLLEEMGYLALRHLASEYDKNGVDLKQCLEIVYTCVIDLTHDGLYSRQLGDLADLLCEPRKTYAEICNVLREIQRNYQHIVHRVIRPFENMRTRLDFDEEELRTAVANMQRSMHDLNSIASFLDIALAYIANEIDDPDSVFGPDAGAEPDPFAILHLSHRREIANHIEGEDSTISLRGCYGGKGSGLLYISYLGLPTRDGFILPTTLARHGAHKSDDQRLYQEIEKHVRILEEDIASEGQAKRLGDPENPLLLAVRGGSVFSMPGMLSTIAFVGMNDEIAAGLAAVDPWCAYDSYRRFLASYAEAAWGMDVEEYGLVDETKRRYNVDYKEDLPWEGMKEIVEETKNVLRQQNHGDQLDELLDNPLLQVEMAVRTVFDSWDGEGAKRYRDIKDVCESWQTAVIVQEMALGNRRNDDIQEGMDESRASLTGVVPRTRLNDFGVRVPTGDFKFSAHGDDLVGGLTRSISLRPMHELSQYMPMLDRNISDGVATLRRFLGTDQEVEFTVERGVLSILQSRAAEVGVNARLSTFEDSGGEVAGGVGVRGGAFRGLVAFDESDLKTLGQMDLSERDDVDGILTLVENPSPDEIPLILLADGLLAARGGSTSHAAIAVNGIEGRDYCAVVGVEGLRVNTRKHMAEIVDRSGNTVTVKVGDVISIHGTTGLVYLGSRTLKGQ
jgi:enolase